MARDNGFTVQIGTGSNLNPKSGAVKTNFKCGSGGKFRSHHKQVKRESSNKEDVVWCKTGVIRADDLRTFILNVMSRTKRKMINAFMSPRMVYARENLFVDLDV